MDNRPLIPTNVPQDPFSFRVFSEVTSIHLMSHTLLERSLPRGLKAAHFNVLNYCVRMGDNCTPVQLAKAFNVTKGAMTNTLTRLESRGFIRIESDPLDGRSKRVFLTHAGREMRRIALQDVSHAFEPIVKGLSTKEYAEALPLLEKIHAALSQFV